MAALNIAILINRKFVIFGHEVAFLSLDVFLRNNPGFYFMIRRKLRLKLFIGPSSFGHNFHPRIVFLRRTYGPPHPAKTNSSWYLPHPPTSLNGKRACSGASELASIFDFPIIEFKT